MESESDLGRVSGWLWVIHNPTAGRSARLLEPVLQRLEEKGFVIELKRTQKIRDAEDLAREAVQSASCDTVIAAGGDGTINEVVNGLLGSPLPLGIFPLGTENVLAREIGLQPTVDAMADCIVKGHAVSVQVGLLNRRAFLLMVGVGLDGRAVRDVRPGLKKKTGKLAYAVSVLEQILFHPPKKLSVEIDGKTYAATWVVVSNAAYYGGMVRLAPGTSLSREGFTVSLFAREGRCGALLDLAAFAARRWLQSRVTQVQDARDIRITGDAEEPVQADGDLAGTLPARILAAPEPLKLLIPESRDRSAPNQEA